MKKMFVLIAILVFPFIVFAKEVEVKDINIKFKINDDYIVLLRDNLDNNADLKKLGISENYMKNIMDKSNIYADIISSDISHEIIIVVPDVKLTFYNLSDATDDMLNDLKNELVKKTGAEISSIYKGTHNYIVVDYYDDNTNYYIVNYYTVVNAKGYNIQLQKKSTITEEEKEELKNVVDSINIDIISDDGNGINLKHIIIGAVIGASVGLISYIVGLVMRKKKASEESKKNDVNKKKVLKTEDNVMEEKNTKSSG